MVNTVHWSVPLASMVRTVKRLVNVKMVEPVITYQEGANAPQGGWVLCMYKLYSPNISRMVKLLQGSNYSTYYISGARASVLKENMEMNVHLNVAVKMVAHATPQRENVTAPLGGL